MDNKLHMNLRSVHMFVCVCMCMCICVFVSIFVLSSQIYSDICLITDILIYDGHYTILVWWPHAIMGSD